MDNDKATLLFDIRNQILIKRIQNPFLAARQSWTFMSNFVTCLHQYHPTSLKIHTTLPEGLKAFYSKELATFRACYDKAYYQQAWRHLERAHILGQAYPIAHTAVHWEMLKFGVQLKDWKEVTGQLPRLLVGGVKSFVGHIPVGNTGGANVPPLQPMEIPEDLQEILAPYKR